MLYLVSVAQAIIKWLTYIERKERKRYPNDVAKMTSQNLK